MSSNDRRSGRPQHLRLVSDAGVTVSAEPGSPLPPPDAAAPGERPAERRRTRKSTATPAATRRPGSARREGRGSAAIAAELDAPLRGRLGPKTAEALAAELDLRSVGDLLYQLPRTVVRHGELTDLARVRVGEHVTIVGKVESLRTRSMRRRTGTMLDVLVGDDQGHRIPLTFFSIRGPQGRLQVGDHALFAGKVTTFNGKLRMDHPACERLGGDDDGSAAEAFVARPIPVYRATQRLTSWQIGKAVRTVLDTLGPLPDPLPQDVRERHHLSSRRDAFQMIHRPQSTTEWYVAQKRFRWDEAFLLQVELARRRAEARSLLAYARPRHAGGLLEQFDERLPFELTPGQLRVGSEIEVDLAAEHPMHRLLHGEVGAGKTVVALRAMLAVIDAGGQAAMLAPTEVLAQQHHRSITAMLGSLADAGRLGSPDCATAVVLLTGSMSAAERRSALDAARTDAGIVIGTHALLEEHVQFRDLGLVVVDEQHRFGVRQRDRLRTKAERPPHVLVMTATPIPRTIAMTVFGDLDVSSLSEQPAGRAGVETHVVPELVRPHFLERAWQRVREEVAASRQAFVVCPQIERSDPTSVELGDDPADPDDPTSPGSESPDLDGGELLDLPGETSAPARRPARPPYAVVDLLPGLVRAGGPLHDLRVEALHGRMAPEDKDDVMRRFAGGDVDVLVATTVVEVGVDVPNASAMVILDAQRFGMSQLHQLRGRVARGSARGICLLVTSADEGSPGWERVHKVAQIHDGFELAEADLDQRREGDVLGRSQSGWRSSLRHVRVLRDKTLIEATRTEAATLVAADPQLERAPILRAELEVLTEGDRTDFLERG